MPIYSKNSVERLSSCHKDLQVIFNEVIKYFNNSIITGHRNEEEQRKAYLQGNSKLNWPQNKHNKLPAMAVDAMPYPIDWRDTSRMYYFAGLVKGITFLLRQQGKISHGVRFGGDWDSDTEVQDNRFNDLVHFELVDK